MAWMILVAEHCHLEQCHLLGRLTAVSRLLSLDLFYIFSGLQSLAWEFLSQRVFPPLFLSKCREIIPTIPAPTPLGFGTYLVLSRVALPPMLQCPQSLQSCISLPLSLRQLVLGLSKIPSAILRSPCKPLCLVVLYHLTTVRDQQLSLLFSQPHHIFDLKATWDNYINNV